MRGLNLSYLPKKVVAVLVLTWGAGAKLKLDFLMRRLRQQF